MVADINKGTTMTMARDIAAYLQTVR